MARYKVTGSHEVCGHEPGEEFEDDLDAITKARLVGGGHIEHVATTTSNGSGYAESGVSARSSYGHKPDSPDSLDNDDADQDAAA
jgi:hypothetical protein